MNKGLPSLLHAIFGTKDLEHVSLEEINHVIDEFPSFNAAHFLLSKKLRPGSAEEYDRENQRTALYFNNAFWLQSLLDEGGPIKKREVTEVPKPYLVETELAAAHPQPIDLPQEIKEEDESEAMISNETYQTETAVPDNHIPDQANNFPEAQETEPVNETTETPVTSFDDLLAKYNATEITAPAEQTEVPADVHSSDTVMDNQYDFNGSQKEPVTENNVVPLPPPMNEYGIFEDEDESDQDMEAFDRPYLQPQYPTPEHVSEPIAIEEVSAQEDNGQFEGAEENAAQQEPVPAYPEPSFAENELVNESISETEVPIEPDEPPVEQDYDSFDRSPDITTEVEKFNEEQLQASADDTDEVPPESGEDVSVNNDGQMQHLSDRFEEQQRALPAFDTKKAEEIVFAPYHVIDYFASQGIKLVLEDQPADQFGKQLKSFTDWLKVMKKLPLQQSVSAKTDELDADRIRHFAAHSIEERDVLTESMAEVLVKQGMHEKAIALYEKLSLIYPFKSAYFASRIEQLKAH